MGKRKITPDEWIKKVYDLVGDEYTVLEDYINTDTKILMRHNCEKCNNYEFPMRPKDFKRGNRCPKCAGVAKKAPEEWVKEVYDLVGDEYTVLEDYKTNNKKILMRHNCNKCNNNEFPMKPNDFQQGYRCPKCAGVAKKTPDEFIKEVYELVENEYTILESYKTNDTKILMRHNCEKCNNYEFPMRPNSFLSGQRCPKCNELNNTYKGEEIIKEYLSSSNYSFIHHHTFEDCRNIRPLPFDFYLKDENLIIEFDGKQHFSSESQYYDPEQQKRDRIKDQYCLDNNITILRIAYKELNNLEDILDSWFENGILSTTDNILLYENGEKIIQGVYKDIIE